MWLHGCSDDEKLTLMAIAALAASLPRGLADYANALTEINRKYFHLQAPKLADLNPAPGSVAKTRNIRATRN